MDLYIKSSIFLNIKNLILILDEIYKNKEIMSQIVIDCFI